jgi:hypothetical protein
MRKTRVFAAAAAAAALILAGIAGWANSNERALEAKASIAPKSGPSRPQPNDGERKAFA